MSDKYTRCPICNGTKEVIGLGLLRKECDECLGVGYIAKEPLETPMKRTRMRKKSIELNQEV